MKKVYFLESLHMSSMTWWVLLVLDKLDESKRQIIRDAIEIECGYFCGEDSILLDNIITVLLKGEKCGFGDDENTNKTVMIKNDSDKRLDYWFCTREMEVY